MKTKLLLCLIAILTLTINMRADEVAGTVLAVTAGSITVQKGTEAWVIKRTASTKITGEAKVGSTVTVVYNAPDGQKREEPISAPTSTPSKD